jgi:hypothetical protein
MKNKHNRTKIAEIIRIIGVDRNAGLNIWTKRIPNTGVINEPEILCALLRSFDLELIITLICILRKDIKGDNRKATNKKLESVKTKIFPSKYGINIRLTIKPIPIKQRKLIIIEGKNETSIFPIINSFLVIGSNAKLSIVFLSFSPAKESAEIIAGKRPGINKNMGSRNIFNIITAATKCSL